jgi:hypothetical protein
MLKVHPQTHTLPAEQVDTAILHGPPKLLRHKNSMHVLESVKKHSIVGVLHGPIVCGPVWKSSDSKFIVPIRQMRTYFKQQKNGKITRTDSYSDRDVIVAYLDASHCALAQARKGTTTANAALVQAYDGANHTQVCVWSLSGLLEGEEVILLD